MNEKIIAGNFKSNLNRKQTSDYLSKLSLLKSKHKIFIFPSISSMPSNDYDNITIGTQNCYPAASGAFTGEITLEHLEELNINTILIGHSERRNLFFESDKVCAEKFAFFKERDFCIFYCIGEDLATRKAKKERDFLSRQLDFIDTNYSKLVIAYEPIWAIGTGVNASLEQIGECMEFLKSRTNAAIIYGGSVNENNSSEILDITDGILVGSASLDINKFHQILRSKE